MCSKPWFSQRNAEALAWKALRQGVGNRVGVGTVEGQRELVVVGRHPGDRSGHVGWRHTNGNLGCAGAVLAGSAVEVAVPGRVRVERIVEVEREVVAVVAEVHTASHPGDDPVTEVLELHERGGERSSDDHLLDARVRIDADQRTRNTTGQRCAQQRRVARTRRQRRRREWRGDVAPAAGRERHGAVQISEPAGETRRRDGRNGSVDVATDACVVETNGRVRPVVGVDLTNPEVRLIRPERRALGRRQRRKVVTGRDNSLVERLRAGRQERIGDHRASCRSERHGGEQHTLRRHLRLDRIDPRRVVIEDEHPQIGARRHDRSRRRQATGHRHSARRYQQDAREQASPRQAER